MATQSDFKESSASPNYSFTFAFERAFDRNRHHEWMIHHWHQAFYYVGIYVIAIFVGQAYMRSRARFELRRTLVAWNVLLSVFSILGSYRTLPELASVLREFGFTYSVCNSRYTEDVKVTAFWLWLFTCSKVIELGDTVFIILRKRQLIFLHWYHHVTVLLFTWYSYVVSIGPGGWYFIMNYFVHSLMYAYYALRAMKFKLPRSVSIAITSLQILQMAAGCIVTCFAYLTRRKGEFCALPDDVANYALLMYSSYLVLFARYFYCIYLAPRHNKKTD